MSDVPPEIIKEILVRLPVKSLLRFRCVSKPWRSMIDSKQFTKSHLRNSYETNSNRTLVVQSNEFYCVDLDEFKLLEIGDHINNFELLRVSCCCNGLVLLEFGSIDLLLWNPATRQFSKLPTPPPLQHIRDKLLIIRKYYGLGYDSKHDDYKVVRVSQASTWLDGGFVSTKATMYSLRSNTWKSIEDFAYILNLHRMWGVYLNDALHTLVKDDDDVGQHSEEVIMAFNIANEQHYEVPMPSMDRGGGLDLVEVMGGLLTAVVRVEMNVIEVWVMKEYGVKESWTKLLCFQPPIGHNPCIYLCPLAYSKSGDEVLLNCDGRCLIWYDLRKKAVTVACVPGLTASFNVSTRDKLLFRAVFCVGSLVSPHSPAAVEAGDGVQQGKEIIQKKRDDFLSVGFKLKL